MSRQSSPQYLESNVMQWFDTPAGRYLQQQEQSLYDTAVVDLFGFNAVQMGCLQMDLLRNSRIAHPYKAADETHRASGADLQCCDDFLPFADSSVDLLLLPHRLEFSERPHQTLREAERVMMPEGHLLISGFNPYSLWGLALAIKRLFSNRSMPRPFPWNGRFIGLARLKDWLTLLGFEVVSIEICCHIPPFQQHEWQRRFSCMDKLGARWLTFLGGVYFIVAKKRVVGVTPLKPNWKKSSLQSSLVPRPTQRKPTQSSAISSRPQASEQ